MAERQLSTSSSRPSHRSRTSFRSSNPDVFSDEFALEPFEISNALESRPWEGDGSHIIASPTGLPSQTERSIAQQYLSDTVQGLPRRSNGSQRYSGRSSITSRHDTTSPFSTQAGGLAPVSDSLSDTSDPHRSISSSSTLNIPRTQSPYQGATGPSQPYGLYPQDIGISRTPSAATTSTVRMPERIYTGPVRPTQPYGLYPQHTVPEDEVSPLDSIAPAPVGFPGLSQDYRRQFGPDGEEAADLVGPDGHTEQLPPYTRYPNDLPTKDGPSSAHPPAPPAATSAAVSSAIMPGLSPVSPVVAAGDNLEASQNTLTSARSNSTETRSPTVDDSSTQLNTTSPSTTAQQDDGGHFKESMSEKSKKRVCWDKIPIWALLLLLLVVGILIGAVIGGILGHKAGQEKATESIHPAAAAPQGAAPSTVVVTATSLVDAVPVSATPIDLPPLPSGTFALTLGSPFVSSNSCLNSNAQRKAWQCANGQDFKFEIIQPGCNFRLLGPEPNAPIHYGAQPPQMGDPTWMSLMNDKDGWNRGPAFFFQRAFDKVVVVKESEFSATIAKRSFVEFGEYDELATLEDRDLTSSGPPDAIAVPTSKPWFCYWNDTMMEGFIYVTQNTNSSNASTSSTSPPSIQESFGSNAITSVTSLASSAASSAPGHLSTREIFPSKDPASFPKLIKIEERRNILNPVQPYCVQMQILNNNKPGSLADPTTRQAIRVNLTENEVPQQKVSTHGPPGRRRSWHLQSNEGAEKRDMIGSNCECRWLSS